ncbi:hypothetical protein V6N11_018898 [Hibiscus sabdariffa]|uniref:Uncharacterized protein n=1 Tax=Hibiscus sabdariffa TaxID=183260 RepID=A0ABR2R1C6_9ROSI
MTTRTPEPGNKIEKTTVTPGGPNSKEEKIVVTVSHLLSHLDNLNVMSSTLMGLLLNSIQVIARTLLESKQTTPHLYLSLGSISKLCVH